MADAPAAAAPGDHGDDAAQLYLARVIAEIDEEVIRRRASGDLPQRIEHELDELFLRFSPMAGRNGSLEEALGVVESTSFVDPVVPVRSSRAGGALVKRTIRQASLWYVEWVTAQINQFASATSRTLRALDDKVHALQTDFDAQRSPPAPVIETDWAHGDGAWWAPRVIEILRGSDGRILHAAAADGWLVRRLAAEGVDAYGVEPREARIDRSGIEGLDLREQPLLDHLRAVAPDALGGLVLTGVVDGMTAAERDATLRLAARAVADGGHAILHTLSPAGWGSDDAPVEADLASGRPLRPRSWVAALEAAGFRAEVVDGPRSLDYLVIAGRWGRGGRRAEGMKIVFVTPRYDPEAIGGAEAAARLLAEHLAVRPGLEVAAYSTCAVDHVSWRNELPAGSSEMNGVALTRFKVASERPHEFFKFDSRLRRSPRHVTWDESRRWLELNGPDAPELIGALEESDADVVVLSPYLFAVTVEGVRASRAPTLLHPAAHNEPPLHFPAIGEAFTSADALCFYSAAESRLVQRVHAVAEKPQIVLGIGVGEPGEGGRPGGEILGLGDRPYLVFVARIEAQKGADALVGFFRRYKEQRPGPLALALVGPLNTDIEPHPDIVTTGPVDEPTKWDVLRDATAFVHPSALESFSLAIMEAWLEGVPVVVNAWCEPTREHCADSSGGLWFGSYRQFEVVIDRLVADAELRRWLGENGRAYVREHYQWPALVSRYARFLESVVERGPAAQV